MVVCAVYMVCVRYSRDTPHVAIFFSFDALPEIIKRIRFEADIKCDKKLPFRRALKEQTIGNKRTFGFLCFPFDQLRASDSITWIIALKMYRADRMNPQEKLNKDVDTLLSIRTGR